MSRSALVLLACAAVSTNACRRKPRTGAAHDAGTVESPFVIAMPLVSEAPVPARFAAPLPATVEEIDTDAVPPGPWVRMRLAAGDTEVQRRLLDAIRGAGREEAVPDELVFHYVYRVFDYVPAPSACAWARTAAGADEPPAVKAVLFRMVARCPDEASGELLLTAGAPPARVIEWAFERSHEHPIAFDARIVAAAAEVARAGEVDLVRAIGFVLAGMGEHAVPAVDGILQDVSRSDLRALITLGLLRHPSPEAQELGRSACRELPGDAMCQAPIEVGPVDHELDREDEVGEIDPDFGFAGTSFDTETGQFPNEHDALLATLAGLTPALAGAVFEERAPEDDVGPYVLRGYLDGKRYQLPAENLEDWYDVNAVVGLLNAMLVAKGSDWRLLSLETGDQTAIVVAGVGSELRAAVATGRLRPGASDAIEHSKAFEREVIDRLQRGEE